MQEGVLQKLRKDLCLHEFRDVFFAAGVRATVKDFQLFLETHLLHMHEMPFTVTSAGLLLITENTNKDLCVLLVNEEIDRWDISSGHVEQEDLNTRHTALREFSEETSIKLPENELISLAFAINPSSANAGIQYMAITQLPIELQVVRPYATDLRGREYYAIPRDREMLSLALEPLGLFFRRFSLLSESHHKWAYSLTKRAVRQKFGLARAVELITET